MIKLMATVVRDIVSEKTGIESLVGQKVEVIKKIPSMSLVTMSAPGAGKPRSTIAKRDVYLVQAPKPRWTSGGKRLSRVMILYKGYEGNDVYSAEELGIPL